MADTYFTKDAATKTLIEYFLSSHISETFIKDVVEQIPAVDVRPVVLCRDCREYDITGYDETPGFGWCKCMHKAVQSCFYCAHGEARKGD